MDLTTIYYSNNMTLYHDAYLYFDMVFKESVDLELHSDSEHLDANVYLLKKSENYGIVIRLGESDTLCISSDDVRGYHTAVAISEPLEEVLLRYANDTENAPASKKNIGYWAFENKELPRSEKLELDHSGISSDEIMSAIRAVYKLSLSKYLNAHKRLYGVVLYDLLVGVGDSYKMNLQRHFLVYELKKVFRELCIDACILSDTLNEGSKSDIIIRFNNESKILIEYDGLSHKNACDKDVTKISNRLQDKHTICINIRHLVESIKEKVNNNNYHEIIVNKCKSEIKMLENEVSQCLVETLNVIKNINTLKFDADTIKAIDIMIHRLDEPEKKSIAKISTEDEYEKLRSFHSIYDMTRIPNTDNAIIEPIIDYIRDFPYILEEIKDRYPKLDGFWIKINSKSLDIRETVSVNPLNGDMYVKDQPLY